MLVFEAVEAALAELNAEGVRPTSLHAAMLAEQLLSRGAVLDGVSRTTNDPVG